jgi:hypothetical protein
MMLPFLFVPSARLGSLPCGGRPGRCGARRRSRTPARPANPAALPRRSFVHFLAAAGASRLFSAARNCIDRCPGAARGFLCRYAAALVTFLDVPSLPLLLFGVFGFVASWHLSPPALDPHITRSTLRPNSGTAPRAWSTSASSAQLCVVRTVRGSGWVPPLSARGTHLLPQAVLTTHCRVVAPQGTHC